MCTQRQCAKLAGRVTTKCVCVWATWNYTKWPLSDHQHTRGPVGAPAWSILLNGIRVGTQGRVWVCACAGSEPQEIRLVYGAKLTKASNAGTQRAAGCALGAIT
jgi:hypothetical protein